LQEGRQDITTDVHQTTDIEGSASVARIERSDIRDGYGNRNIGPAFRFSACGLPASPEKRTMHPLSCAGLSRTPRLRQGSAPLSEIAGSNPAMTADSLRQIVPIWADRAPEWRVARHRESPPPRLMRTCAGLRGPFAA